MAKRAADSGHEQALVVGLPYGDSCDLASSGLVKSFPLYFGTAPLSFKLPVMAGSADYPSCSFSDLSAQQITEYRQAWIEHLFEVRDKYDPDVIHTHHAWIVSSLIHEIWPNKPVVVHTHQQDLNLMAQIPKVLEPLRELLHSANAFIVKTDELADRCAEALGIDRARFTVVGGPDNCATATTDEWQTLFEKTERTWRCLAKDM